MRSTYVRRLIEDDREHISEDGYSNELLEFVSLVKDMCSVFIYRVFGPAPSLFLRIRTDYNFLHYLNLKSIK